MRTLGLAVVLVVAACGDDGVKHLADAPPHPAIDAPEADAPPSPPVRITVMDGGVPRQGVAVYFQAADSTMIATVATDASGTASAVMPHGGFVTVVDPFLIGFAPLGVGGGGGHHVLKTFANVAPGDHLVLNDPNVHVSTTLTVALPLDASGPTDYSVYADCGAHTYDLFDDQQFGTATFTVPTAKRHLVGAGSPGSVTLHLRDCLATTASFIVLTRDPETSLPLHVAVATDVALAGGGVDLTAAAFADVPQYTLDVANGGDQGAAFVALNLLGTGGEFQTAYDSTHASVELTSGAGSALVGIPAVTGTKLVVSSSLVAGGGSGQQTGYVWGLAPVAGHLALDLAGKPLLDFAASGSPTYDGPTETWSWPTVAGTMPNAYYLSSAFFDSATNTDWTWDIVGAFSGPAVAYPALPAPAADFSTAETGNLNALIVARIPGGYDLVREHAFDLIQPGGDLTPLALGNSGAFETDEYLAVDKRARSKMVTNANSPSPRSPAAPRDRRVR